MKITIVCVGKIKETFYREAVAEYQKRLGKYCKIEIVEVADEKTPDGAGEALANMIKEKEAKRILEVLPCNKALSHNQLSKNSGKCLSVYAGDCGEAFFLRGNGTLDGKTYGRWHQSYCLCDWRLVRYT